MTNEELKTLPQLAESGQSAWRMMMAHIESPDNNPGRIHAIHYWNKQWLDINTQIRDGKYHK